MNSNRNLNTWGRTPDQLAARATLSQLRGINKPLLIDDNTTAIVYDASHRKTVLEPGTYKLDSLWGRLNRFGFGKKGAILLVDTGTHSIRFSLEGVNARDEIPMRVALAMTISVTDPILFSSGLMRNRQALKHEELIEEIEPLADLALGLELPRDVAENWADRQERYDDLADVIQQEMEPELIRRGVDGIRLEVIRVDYVEAPLKERETERIEERELRHELRALEANVDLDDLERKVQERLRERQALIEKETGKSGQNFEREQFEADQKLDKVLADIRRQISHIESQGDLDQTIDDSDRERTARREKMAAEMDQLRESLRHTRRLGVLQNQAAEQSLEDEAGIQAMQHRLKRADLQMTMLQKQLQADEMRRNAKTDHLRDMAALARENDEHEWKLYRERQTLKLDEEQSRHLREMEIRRLETDTELEGKRIELDHDKTVAKKDVERELSIREVLERERLKQDGDQRHAFDTLASLAGQAMGAPRNPASEKSRSEESTPKGRLCVTCGRTVEEGAKFCAACGNQLEP